MFVFILANLPLPVILYLNYLVTAKYLRIRRSPKRGSITKPERLHVGFVLSNTSVIFALIPIINEHRIFVQGTHWLIFFGIAAAMTITGLALINSGLAKELRSLQSPRRARRA
jgi:hypothetical protein